MDNENLITIFFGLLFWICGVQLNRGKWLFLFSGYTNWIAKKNIAMKPEFIAQVLGTTLLISCLTIAGMLMFTDAKDICLMIQVLIFVGAYVYLHVARKKMTVN